MSAGQTH